MAINASILMATRFARLGATRNGVVAAARFGFADARARAHAHFTERAAFAERARD
jgi:hypothetical protein